MSPAAAWLIAELTKLTVQRLEAAGKLNSLSQEEAEAELVKLTGGLLTVLPSPQDLMNPPA